MKKLVSIFLVIALALTSMFALAGCSKGSNTSFEVVMLTDGASVDDKAYNSYVWKGVKSFAEENEYACRYYQPSLDENNELSLETVENYVKLSVDNGAKYIVLQGEDYGNLVEAIAPNYADVNFVMLGANISAPISNVMTVSFDSLQAGFLAGYASVAMGNEKLGYLGSIEQEESASYGAGYVQGAGLAADEASVPTILDYANFDDHNLDYDYSFTITPVYIPVSDAKEKTFKVNVINGKGSGVYTDGENVAIIADPAPEGKVFDHWEKTSNTEDVKDKKVNINSTSKEEINLLVGDCDCTLEAVYVDAKTQPIKVQMIECEDVSKSSFVTVDYAPVFAPENSTYTVKAPVCSSGYVFSCWGCDDGIVEDVNDPWAKVNVTDQPITLQAIYVKSNEPTYDVTVVNGTGSGSYKLDDYIEIYANAPEDGYMFYKWENVDNQGLPSGIQMENEYKYNTSFSMIDRCASLIKMFYNKGTDVVFGGGNSHADSIFTATWDYTYPVYAFGWGVDQRDNGNCLASVVTDYNMATYEALTNFKGGTNYEGNCANGCLYVTGISKDATYKDDEGNDVENEEYNEGYANVYNKLADGTLKVRAMPTDYNVTKLNSSTCLTLNYIVK